MPTNHNFLGLSIQEWAALATIVSGIAVIVLIFVNVLYLRTAKRQTKAIQRQATESQRQADAANNTLEFLRQESKEKDLEQVTSICLTLKTTLERVMDVKGLISSIGKPGVRASWVKIVPYDWSSILSEAGRISEELYARTSAVGEQLRKAEQELTWCVEVEPTYKDLNSIQHIPRLLDETGPLLDGIRIEFEARRKKMLPMK